MIDRRGTSVKHLITADYLTMLFFYVAILIYGETKMAEQEIKVDENDTYENEDVKTLQ